MSKSMPPVREYGNFIRAMRQTIEDFLALHEVALEDLTSDNDRPTFLVVNYRVTLMPSTLDHSAGAEPYLYQESYDTYAEALRDALNQMEHNIRHDPS